MSAAISTANWLPHLDRRISARPLAVAALNAVTMVCPPAVSQPQQWARIPRKPFLLRTCIFCGPAGLRGVPSDRALSYTCSQLEQAISESLRWDLAAPPSAGGIASTGQDEDVYFHFDPYGYLC